MTTLQNKIDFAVILRVKNANPNGDPLNGNRPRTDYSNFGEMTDVSIKRKIRDRLLERWVAAGKADDGNMIFVQSDDRKADEYKSLRARAEAVLGKALGSDQTALLACSKWLDVRAFGQLFALKSNKKAGKKNDDGSDDEGDTGVSIGIRGPVTVQSAFSVEPIDITSTQITKSVSGEGDGTKRSSDTMGTKHRVDQGIYRFFGSMNPQLAEKTGFSDADAQALKAVLPKLFENDESSARPAGSMEVVKVIWWQHNCKSGQYSSAKVHRSLTVNPDGSYSIDSLDGLVPECLDGF
ncbi:CRISPR-associated protein, Csd2 family [Rhodoferax ferrireducens T118]|uniref:CRISPR-associated protein, Csd2 family n=1 Tax=Albidiferax ferrireducens (strain ATCC BAA-621 / DSM 15236 / T118) TaxID=338969 RepID=Q21RK0_ALBFT|nr:type I-C CRISPR-associated protein Cas7/Csd2 [Rhodoferax ferrireducens]ABD71603.1 CRISPR-associated protein, Csd2 family [Rhodoferax ferrireducens T118]